MTKQLCFRGLKPTRPTMRTPSVARRIAERIVKEVNLDEFYWPEGTLPDRIADVADEIVANGKPRTMMARLAKKNRMLYDLDGCDGPPYGYEGIDDHCRHIAAEIAAEEVVAAVAKWRVEYGE